MYSMDFLCEACESIIETESLSNFITLSSKCCVKNVRMLHCAAHYRRIDIIHYLLQQDCPMDSFAPAYASEVGDIECLKLLHKFNCPWDYITCHNAASNGYYHCLQYAHENGCDISHVDIYTSAIVRGHLECFIYVYQNISWDDRIWSHAVKCGSNDILFFLYKQIAYRSIHLLKQLSDTQRNYIIHRLRAQKASKIIQQAWLRYYYAPFRGRGFLQAKERFYNAVYNNSTTYSHEINQKLVV